MSELELEDLRAEVEQLRAALPPADKLRIIADWMDTADEAFEFVARSIGVENPARSTPMRQDLRTWAERIDACRWRGLREQVEAAHRMPAEPFELLEGEQ